MYSLVTWCVVLSRGFFSRTGIFTSGPCVFISSQSTVPGTQQNWPSPFMAQLPGGGSQGAHCPRASAVDVGGELYPREGHPGGGKDSEALWGLTVASEVV